MPHDRVFATSDMHGTLFSGARGETTDIVGSVLLVCYVVLT